MEKQRSSFTGKLGFIMAAAGSAVGLGNIWRFPYLAAQYGGGIFLLVYILLAVSFGFTLMVAEIAIGRKTGLSAIEAYKKLDSRFAFVGVLAALIPTIILPYYSVIGGWVTKYLFSFIAEDIHVIAADGYFEGFIASSFPPIFWFFLFIAVTAIVVVLGVEKGIEKVSKVMMPVLAVLTLIVAVYSICLPGSIDGIKYYLLPNFSEFSYKTVLAAMGQMFYSMSLSMGIMITYGSYMKKEVSIEKSVRQIEIFDTGIAFLAGLMIIPAVFVFSGGEKSALNKGPGLMFVTLPKVFESMPAGKVIGAIFFLLVLFAALTSSISLFETVVSFFQDKMKWSRKVSCAVVFGICMLLGVPSSMGNGAWSGFTLLGMDFLSFCDFVTNNLMMPITAFFTCVMAGYVLKKGTLETEMALSNGSEKLYHVVIRYVAPVCILLILLTSVLDFLGIMKL